MMVGRRPPSVGGADAQTEAEDVLGEPLIQQEPQDDGLTAAAVSQVCDGEGAVLAA